jgi:hypothetical protein
MDNLTLKMIEKGASKSTTGYTLATPPGPYQVALNISAKGARIYSASEGITTNTTPQEARDIVEAWPRSWLLIERLCGEAYDRS